VEKHTHWWSLLRESAPLAFENLKRNKLRSLLTIMGVVIGVGSVLSMVTLGQYTKEKVLASYATMGVNSMRFYANPNWHFTATDESPNQFDGLDWEMDVLPLKKLFPEIMRISPQYDAYGMSVIYGGRAIEGEVTVVGVNSEAVKIARRGISLGTPIQEAHVKNKSSACVLGFEVAQRLFLKQSPIGEVIQMATQNDNISCLVVGVLKSSPSGKNDWAKADLQIMVPFTYFKAGPFDI
jgi:putative ABC transport system permease protein